MRHTPEGAALTSLILETFRFNGALLAAGNRLTKPLGLTSARWQVMGAIDLAGQALTVAQIARRMRLARQGVQRIANQLRDLGMVVFQPNLDHKRAQLVALTPKGEAAMAQINKAQIAWVNQLSKGREQGQIVKALELLKTIRAQIDTH